MRKKNIFKTMTTAAVACLLLFSACSKPENPITEDPHALDVNLLRSPTLFANALRSRDAGKDNEFHIEKVERKGDHLIISLKGGSVAEDFKVIWDGSIQLSYPATLRLVIVYDGEGTALDSETKLSVKVDLRKIAPEHLDANQFTFYVINGSIVAQTVLNPNGTSSNQ